MSPEPAGLALRFSWKLLRSDISSRFIKRRERDPEFGLPIGCCGL
jgi:hypothetical protein